jgi:hypothetical protein
MRPHSARRARTCLLSPQASAEGFLMFQRIGWRRPSAHERRWWIIQGVVILGTVLLIGTLLLLALR